ncbi:hypothetical protein [Thioalkalivibrio sulfidiphilus]|uniref:COG3904 family protein n=1 Tax=Thioalkalivibrio sulfidiphilus TaxID=1033854 RepID=UPI003B369D07
MLIYIFDAGVVIVMFRWSIFGFIFALTAATVNVLSAEEKINGGAYFSYFSSHDVVVIDGEIVEGDYQRFLAALLSSGYGASIFISSPGGDLHEAMRIGRLIRKIGYVTDIPTARPDASCTPLYNIQHCTCDSACLFIWLGGIKREGDYITVHRPYIEPSSLREITADEAREHSLLIAEWVADYFQEMGAPRALWDRMSSVSYDRVERLSQSYIERNLSGVSRDYEDWSIARCGRLDAGSSRDTYISTWACLNELFYRHRESRFNEALVGALEELRIAGQITDELAAYLPFIGSETIVNNLVGKSYKHASKVLGLHGFGDPVAWVEDVAGKCVTISYLGVVCFDADGIVTQISMPYYSADGATLFTPTRAYKGKSLHPFYYGVAKGEVDNFITASEVASYSVVDTVYTSLYVGENEDYVVTYNAVDDTLRNLQINYKGYVAELLGLSGSVNER